MRPQRSIVVALLLMAPAALADTDPWAVPAPPGIELMLKLEASEKDYTLMLAGEPWEGANGPERVDLPHSPEDREALARCSALVEQGDHDAATSSIEALLAKNPANWDALLLRAKSLHARKSDADAALALRTSLLGNRRNPDAWNLLDEVAKALSKKVVRPKLAVRGWVRDLGKKGVEIGHVADDDDGMPWNYYAVARAIYRWEGIHARDFPSAKGYSFTFREQMYAMGVLADSAAAEKKDGTKLSADLKRVLAEKSAGTLAPFTFFAVYPEPLPATPEIRFDLLRPRLEKYFDTKILVRG